MQRESFPRGVLFTSLSATALSFVGLFGKLGAGKLPFSSLIFWRFFAAFAFCTLFLSLFGKLSPKDLLPRGKIQLLRACLVLISQYSFFYYIQKESLLNGTVLLNLGPLFIPLIEWGILHHKVGKSTWIGVAVSFAGMLCVLQPGAGIFSFLSLIGVLAGLSQGASQVVLGIASKSERADLSIFYLFFLCALLSFAPYLLEGLPAAKSEANFATNILLIIAVGIASVFNQLSRAVAYTYANPSKLAAFLYLSVPLAGLFDWIVFGKTPNLLSLIGTALVLFGGFLKIYLRARALRSQIFK